MSSITNVEKRYFELAFGMSGGYVLNFSDASFGEFFEYYHVDIHDRKYEIQGTSKANKMRAFWEHEEDTLVARVLNDMLDVRTIGATEADPALMQGCRRAVSRLRGTSLSSVPGNRDEISLDKELVLPSVNRLPVETQVATVIEARLTEAQANLEAGSYLSAIIMWGSVLEEALRGAAEKEPAKFNRASASPKDANGKPKRFRDWSLAELINVAHEVNLIGLDVKKFAHVLRDFRNYIHPHQQIAEGFTPDVHTARICFQVLTAALAGIAGER